MQTLQPTCIARGIRIWQRVRRALVVTALLFAGERAALVAQPALQDMVYTVGTVTRDGLGRDWSYVVWQGTTPDLTLGRAYAVYAKTGDVASAATYTRKAVVLPFTDPSVIQTLLSRSVSLGENLAVLDDHVTALFQAAIPTNTLPLSQKFSAVVRGATQDPQQFQNLLLLSRRHPGACLALGLGFAELLPAGSRITYEIREFDRKHDLDIAVIGRVTVDAGSPVVLPAPGPVVQVPDPTAKGNLNIKLRWASSPALRRLSLLNYGFNVYRMSRAFAEAGNYHVTPPTSLQLLSLVASQPASVRRVNRPPVLASRAFDAADVGNFGPTGDTNTVFVVDDNGRYDTPDGVPFKNGDQYYYFVTALDVLARDGVVSAGVLATACDRLPPRVPTGLSVANDYAYAGGASQQVLKLTWQQNTNPPAGVTNPPPDITRRYRVYRWSNPDEMNALSFNPAAHQIAIVDHVEGQKYLSYVDSGPGSPQAGTDYGKTFWYSVRAEDETSCAPGPNLSGNSVPAWGVLRDRTGPAAGDGRINVVCVRPTVRIDRMSDQGDETLDPLYYHFRLICARTDSAIVWAEFLAMNSETGDIVSIGGRRYFPSGEPELQVDYAELREGRKLVLVGCRAGTSNGKVSNTPFTTVNDGVPGTAERRIVYFKAQTEVTREPANREKDCNRHDPRPPGTGTIEPIDIDIFLTPTTKEYRLYRRVDAGPLTLICQGEGDFDLVAAVKCLDDALPVNSGTLCYYVQLFDEHGNASPMKLLGCLETGGAAELPIPLLSPIGSEGTDAAPQMSVNWFCPRDGVDHFELWVAASPTGGLATAAGVLSTNLGNVTQSVAVGGTNVTAGFERYQTARVGPSFGVGAQFSLKLDIEAGKTYIVVVRAVGMDGDEGELSNAESHVWRPPVDAGPQVPWPARGLPATNANFHPGIAAVRVPNGIHKGLGVRIGEVLIAARQGSFTQREPPWITPGHVPPETYVYTNTATGESLFPLALYRYQVKSDLFPKPPLDIVQVSPLMEQIAWLKSTNTSLPIQAVAQVVDPFVAVFNEGGLDGKLNPTNSLILLDTSPVVVGAKYRYLLVRFKANHEMDQVIPSNEVEVTP